MLLLNLVLALFKDSLSFHTFGFHSEIIVLVIIATKAMIRIYSFCAFCVVFKVCLCFLDKCVFICIKKIPNWTLSGYNAKVDFLNAVMCRQTCFSKCLLDTDCIKCKSFNSLLFVFLAYIAVVSFGPKHFDLLWCNVPK